MIREFDSSLEKRITCNYSPDVQASQHNLYGSNAIQILDVLKKFGWSDVNMTIVQIGPGYYGETQTALL
jgi:hypothetical protein